MANATFSTPINMDALFHWETLDYPIVTSTHVRELGFSGQVMDYHSTGFTFDGEGDIVGGTLTGLTYTLNGVVQYTITGLSHNARRDSQVYTECSEI